MSQIVLMLRFVPSFFPLFRDGGGDGDGVMVVVVVQRRWQLLARNPPRPCTELAAAVGSVQAATKVIPKAAKALKGLECVLKHVGRA
jgi:hypothetical protein